MTTDYQGNAHNRRAKAQGAGDKTAPPKEVKKVVTGEVKVKKRNLGRKIKDLFIEAEFKSVIRHVGMEVLLPAAKNMMYDGAVTIVDRVMFGADSRSQRPYGMGGIRSRISYNNPVTRGIRDVQDVRSRIAPPPPLGPRGRHIYDEVILASKSDADTVLEMMHEILDAYEFVSIFDLNELCGRPTSPVDNNYGWVGLTGSRVRQVPDGYLLELPAPETASQ